MTTQNTESENNDINETVVQQSPASETPIASAEAEITMPANGQDAQTDEMQSNTSEKQIEEEPLRSFADYIEEFRQNEVQYGSVLEEPQVEPFAALMPGDGPEINEFARTNKIKLTDLVFCGGEEYEIVATISKHYLNKVRQIAKIYKIPLFEIGYVTKGKNVVYCQENKIIPIRDCGWLHFKS